MDDTLVTGAGGFIGGHLVKRLLQDGHEVVALDIKPFDEWWQIHTDASNFDEIDLAQRWPESVLLDVDEVYHLAADMGGIEFIEAHKLECALTTLVDIEAMHWAMSKGIPIESFFYTSSACVYPAYKQVDAQVRPLREADVYPADPEDGYGWQKLYTERLLRHMSEDAGVPVRIARLHNVYGPHGTWRGGREKAPAALCRKVATAVLQGDWSIEVYGDGNQTRTFMYVDDCVEGIIRIAHSDCTTPLNLGTDELVTINELAELIITLIAEVDLEIKHIDGALGVRGRSSDNTLIRKHLDWEPSIPLLDGLRDTYSWVFDQVRNSV